jgi:TatD DNase family protein
MTRNGGRVLIKPAEALHACELFDAHCHLDFAQNAPEVARAMEAARLSAVVSTVTPAAFAQARAAFSGSPRIHVALGMHPWWVGGAQNAEGVTSDTFAVNNQLAQFLEMLPGTSIVGEIGLDFSPAHKHTRAVQINAFEKIVTGLAKSARAGMRKVVFLHAVKSTSITLDILKAHGLLAPPSKNTQNAEGVTRAPITFVFHRFAGSPQELERALNCGCCVSLNHSSMASKKGTAICANTWESRLLVETDAPNSGAQWSADAWRRTLEDVIVKMAHARGTTPQELAGTLTQNARRLLASADSITRVDGH